MSEGGRSRCDEVYINRVMRKMPFAYAIKYQRTNGPVNAHLIPGPSMSTKHTKPG